MKYAVFVTSLLTALIAHDAQSAAIEVSGVQTYVGGTTDVTGSGSTGNFSLGTGVGSYAVFDMQIDGSDYADLRVSYIADDGGIGSNVMIAQTSNSQNLKDTGTVSILFNIGNSSGGGGTFQFDWFTAGSFVNGVEQSGSSLLTDSILYTTFDIDYEQYVATDSSQLNYYALDDDTILTADLNETTGMLNIKDNDANSTFDNPETAAQFMTTGTASHQFEMGKQFEDGNALFMFEFRDPSEVLAETGFNPVQVSIPEPSSVTLSALTLVAAFGLRRIFRI
ncbi:hypothetical protein EGM51_12580 [Verrucomicrobia bacterium S94]|nr:hypothetical protein EGM51_12580 [Verrucomicrobia bacterium S94]